MRVVLQRVCSASVSIDNALYAGINHGLLVLLGICSTDTQDDINYICSKIAKLRIFSDSGGKNESFSGRC